MERQHGMECILEWGMEVVDMKRQLDGSQRPSGMGRAFTQVPWQRDTRIKVSRGEHLHTEEVKQSDRLVISCGVDKVRTYSEDNGSKKRYPRRDIDIDYITDIDIN